MQKMLYIKYNELLDIFRGVGMEKYIKYIMLGLACTTFAANASSTDEYVNRIAKRIALVSDQPDSNYQFQVVESPTAGIAFDTETNSILVSSALLAQLQDEAQLAAVLSLGVAKYSQNPEPDRTTINNLYRAGYDPNVLVELQEQYILNGGTRYSWIGSFYNYPLSPSTITYSKSLTSNMPSGLLRGNEEYSRGTKESG